MSLTKNHFKAARTLNRTLCKKLKTRSATIKRITAATHANTRPTAAHVEDDGRLPRAGDELCDGMAPGRVG